MNDELNEQKKNELQAKYDKKNKIKNTRSKKKKEKKVKRIKRQLCCMYM